jgi:hypothetical protein
VAEREAPGDFGYRWAGPAHEEGWWNRQDPFAEHTEPAPGDSVPAEPAAAEPVLAEHTAEQDTVQQDPVEQGTGAEHPPGPGPDDGIRWEEPAAPAWTAPEPFPDGQFDAFNANTWSFKPAPTPWYRTRQATVVLLAAGLAAVALVVSAVLLVFNGDQGGGPVKATPSATPTAPSSDAPAPSLTSEPPPPAPPPPPPPPPPPEQAPAERGPAYYPTQRPRQSNKPEIGVTRTPATRHPISVAPQPRTRN